MPDVDDAVTSPACGPHQDPPRGHGHGHGHGHGAGKEPMGSRRVRNTAAPVIAVVLAVVLAGLAAGLVGLFMAWLLEFFQHLAYGGQGRTLIDFVEGAPVWRRALAPCAGGLLAGGGWLWLRRTGGVVGIVAAVDDRTGASVRRMGVVRPTVDAVLQVLVVGTGNSIGREGAPRQVAAALAAVVLRWLRVGRDWAPEIMASAAGAGLAAIYNTPLGGAAYAVEIVLARGDRRRGVLVAVPISVIATVMSWLHSHGRPTFSLPQDVGGPSWATAVGLVLVLPLAAGAGAAARRLWALARDHKVRATWRLPLAIGAAGAVTGCASAVLAMLPGNGKDAVQVALLSQETATPLLVLAAVLALKPVLTGMTLGAGAAGGLLAPSLATGAALGALVAAGLHLVGLDASTAVLALAGACAVLAVTQRAPVFAVSFGWELARPALWTVPALAVVGVGAYALARRRPDR